MFNKVLVLITLIAFSASCNHWSKTENIQVVDDDGLIAMDDNCLNKFYYKNGQLAFIGEMKNEKPIGEHIYYYENGNISRKSIFKNDCWVMSNYEEDGRHVMTQTIYPDSKYLFGFKNGHLKLIWISDDDDFSPMEGFSGVINEYDAEGNLTKHKVLINGKDIEIK
ncbi:hypothetical protein AAEX28_16005 [Lentisphaerota bacterium WC36G]|nr:hypothetical protein LJT99_02765 [Lentisphaerae bacterium WC36]